MQTEVCHEISTSAAFAKYLAICVSIEKVDSLLKTLSPFRMVKLSSLTRETTRRNMFGARHQVVILNTAHYVLDINIYKYIARICRF